MDALPQRLSVREMAAAAGDVGSRKCGGSEGAFIDSSPLGEAAASRRSQPISSICESTATQRGYSNDDLT